MREIFHLGLALLLICAASAGALTYVDSLTGPVIAERRADEKEQALQAVLPNADEFEESSQLLEEAAQRGDLKTLTGISLGLRGQTPVGAVFTVEPIGYTQEIVMLVGVSSEGKVTGVEILDHLETPGLGSRIEEDWYLDQYLGLETGRDYYLAKDGGDIDAISGATVSCRSVTEGVNTALRAYEALIQGQ